MLPLENLLEKDDPKADHTNIHTDDHTDDQKAEDLKGIIEFRPKERDKLFQPRGEEAGDRPES